MYPPPIVGDTLYLMAKLCPAGTGVFPVYLP